MKNKELLQEDVETMVDEFKIDIGGKVSIEWGFTSLYGLLVEKGDGLNVELKLNYCLAGSKKVNSRTTR